ncbi:hypothetical protein [Shewanella maritima]|uniref:hypothetical protein n=1 Tax=Shewanella maritima TaxID=2520507 RepID=UPI0037367BB4
MATHTEAELGLSAEVALGYQASLLSVYLKPMNASELLAFETKTETWLAANSPLEVSEAVSHQLMFAHLGRDNAKTMLISFALALVVLALIVTLIKRSWSLGLIALMLNFLPLLWVFGLWSWLGGHLSLGSTIVLGIMLGIIVDDSLHLMLRLPSVKSGTDFKTSTDFIRPYTNVMSVVTFTTVTLVLGFSIGLGSDFLPILQLSLLSCMVIALAWLFDVLLLPVFYRMLGRDA